jgi:hypothetical protein
LKYSQIGGHESDNLALLIRRLLAFVFLDHSGAFPEFKMVDGTLMKLNSPLDAPYSFIMAELLKIKNKKILQVEAVLLEAPYGMPSGWVK